MTTLRADANGVVSGKFTIPDNIPVGSKKFSITGASGSHGQASFTGSGLSRIDTMQQITYVSTQYIDPLAQTFTLPSFTQLAAVDLWFTDKGTSRVLVQIRETQQGFPTRTVLAQVQLNSADLQINGQPTRVTFRAPVALSGGTEYALVVLCDDAKTALAIAELGKFDAANQRWVTSQTYSVGVLLSSSNASTWTAHQDKDLAFRMYKAAYKEQQRVIDLGVIPVVNATDLMLLAMQETPLAQARIEYVLTLPNNTVIVVADGQPVRLSEPVTGNISIAARLSGDARVSPVLYPGTQILVSTVNQQDDYVGRSIPAGQNARVRVIYEALLPGGSSIEANVSTVADGSVWQAVPNIGATQIGDGWMEMTHELIGVNADTVRTKLNLSGNTAARPRVHNLRCVVL